MVVRCVSFADFGYMKTVLTLPNPSYMKTVLTLPTPISDEEKKLT